MAEKSKHAWTATHLPDLTGRTVVVTGANSGIGRTTADALARAGAHVVLAVRDPERGRAAAAGLSGSTEVRRLDLADLASVREFAAGWSDPLYALVNNAGVMMLPRRRTEDGFEMQFGTNHLGHFALTNLLLPHVTDRVVTLSSSAHRWGGATIEFDDLDLTARYTPQRAYAQSKLANLLFTLELQRRLSEAGSPVRALAAHPGYAATNLQSHTANPVVRGVLKVTNRFLAQDDRAGALPTLYAVTQDLPGASYVGPDGFAEARGVPTLVGRSRAASDPHAARRLWGVSEELTGVRFPLAVGADS
ncbi:oxidoreductase [Streptomyces griseomycini]|uniref:NAD(P)-dependent dehydrogenase (Short-subunit alcohol dehydrogenase family) n=1 Tax=Streptomyces griseomycini TaxID=66895 RepID=A0A7W7M229_9ACTN|nr:oxidoreductase [Streptomyces griseomycini]MBB4900479.1 NAD(P)-dependent dehydrogenase (short-subunit alcohol dehydrogenase family) [Streptomyces griseomycini]GGQ25333.1 putative short-chain dehydrogenase/reductase [Streptomyces griseomycini]GGR38106.1 putative short-chain dehydrogenase/reductase [Streptomyces griseomycini]